MTPLDFAHILIHLMVRWTLESIRKSNEALAATNRECDARSELLEWVVSNPDKPRDHPDRVLLEEEVRLAKEEWHRTHPWAKKRQRDTA